MGKIKARATWAWERSRGGCSTISCGTTCWGRDTQGGHSLMSLKVSLGWGHALACTIDGKLFGWGYAADGRLGQLGGTVETSPLDTSATLLRRRELNSHQALEIAEKLVMVSMEKEKDMPIVWEPHVIEELQLVGVTDVSCGLDHSLVICRDGALRSGGSNIYGQLGRQNQDLGLFPVDIEFSPFLAASGLGHSMAICKISASEDPNKSRNVVLSWGWDQSYQLGRVGLKDKPSMVEGLAEEAPTAISCGRAHSLAVTAGGGLWVWGCGKNGRLGLGSSFDEPEPVLVDIGGHKVIQVVAGFDHTLILVSES